MLSLYAPQSYWDASSAERESVCNGCGSANSKFSFLIPNTFYGLDIEAACNIHDWMYHVAEPTAEAKAMADRVFLNNMIRIVNDRGGWFKFLRRRRALKYYWAVKYGGGGAFWDSKNKPANLGKINVRALI